MRIPEQQVMDDPEQIAQYIRGCLSGIMSISQRSIAKEVNKILPNGGVVLDLGCGPGVQLSRFDHISHFIGIDLSKEMLKAAKFINPRYEFIQENMINMGFEDNSVDGVVSCMALHHLRDEEELWQCFREIARVVKPGGMIYLKDFYLVPKYLQTSITGLARPFQPKIFNDDFRMSMAAAFDKICLESFSQLLPGVEFTSFFPMVTITTK